MTPRRQPSATPKFSQKNPFRTIRAVLLFAIGRFCLQSPVAASERVVVRVECPETGLVFNLGVPDPDSLDMKVDQLSVIQNPEYEYGGRCPLDPSTTEFDVTPRILDRGRVEGVSWPFQSNTGGATYWYVVMWPENLDDPFSATNIFWFGAIPVCHPQCQSDEDLPFTTWNNAIANSPIVLPSTIAWDGSYGAYLQWCFANSCGSSTYFCRGESVSYRMGSILDLCLDRDGNSCRLNRLNTLIEDISAVSESAGESMRVGVKRVVAAETEENDLRKKHRLESHAMGFFADAVSVLNPNDDDQLGFLRQIAEFARKTMEDAYNGAIVEPNVDANLLAEAETHMTDGHSKVTEALNSRDRVKKNIRNALFSYGRAADYMK